MVTAEYTMRLNRKTKRNLSGNLIWTEPVRSHKRYGPSTSMDKSMQWMDHDRSVDQLTDLDGLAVPVTRVRMEGVSNGEAYRDRLHCNV